MQSICIDLSQRICYNLRKSSPWRSLRQGLVWLYMSLDLYIILLFYYQHGVRCLNWLLYLSVHVCTWYIVCYCTLLLLYVSTVHQCIITQTFQCWYLTLDIRIWRQKSIRRILTSEVDPRTENVKYFYWPWTHNIGIQMKRRELTKALLRVIEV